MRRPITYANVTSTLALVLAMSGGALAARHYLINSTKQINPKVLRKLHGARGAVGQIGPVGPQGVTGTTGPRGVRGPDGEPGFSALSQLPSGKTESGAFTVALDASAEGRPVSTAVTFAVPLAAPIPAEKVEFVTVSTPGVHCLGVGTAPKGYLCVYLSDGLNLKEEEGKSVPGTAFDPEAVATVGSGKFGAGLNWASATGAPTRAAGSYSVTAP